MPTPSDTKLYQQVKKEAKRRFSVWPSAYASAWLAKEYKRRYKGKNPYRSDGSKTTRSEKRGSSDSRGIYKKCGRSQGGNTKGQYPYCRPMRRVNKNTPRTIGEMNQEEKRNMCKKKQKAQEKQKAQKKQKTQEKHGKSPTRVRMGASFVAIWPKDTWKNFCLTWDVQERLRNV